MFYVYAYNVSYILHVRIQNKIPIPRERCKGGGTGGLSESDILVCRGEGGKLCKLMKSESKQPTPPASNKHMYFALSLKMQFVMNIAEKCIHHKQGGIFGSTAYAI